MDFSGWATFYFGPKSAFLKPKMWTQKVDFKKNTELLFPRFGEVLSHFQSFCPFPLVKTEKVPEKYNFAAILSRHLSETIN